MEHNGKRIGVLDNFANACAVETTRSLTTAQVNEVQWASELFLLATSHISYTCIPRTVGIHASYRNDYSGNPMLIWYWQVPDTGPGGHLSRPWRRKISHANSDIHCYCPYTWRPLGRGQDAESNFVNLHSFRNLSAYSWKIPLTVFIPSGLIPRTLLQSIQREQWFLHADRMPKWHTCTCNLLLQPFLILSAL